MAQTEQRVDTLFLHKTDRDYRVTAHRDGTRLFEATLELADTDAGPRPARFRVTHDSGSDPRRPDEFIELARRATHIRISEQTPEASRVELRAVLEAYQLSATVVRTCRYCASAGRYTPITSETAITADDDEICPSCATRELERELTYHGSLSSRATTRLTDLLLSVRDLEQVTNLLDGTLDPELTKFDEISPTTAPVDPVALADLDIHSALHDALSATYDTLLPVQSLAVANGLLGGADQLVVSATATGKTLIGELAGIDRALSTSGKFLFLVPLVALANQKHAEFREKYGGLVDVTIRVGSNRLDADANEFDPNADVIVGTYEGIDHALRTGRSLGVISTVVIDEIHTLATPERGHRLDGLISRLKYYCDTDSATGSTDTQWIYLSATVGNPNELATGLQARLIEYEDRPIPIERHVTFATDHDKPRIANTLVKRAFDTESSKGYRGQTIIFTNSRRRCHEISRRLDYASAPYHAGLSYEKRNRIERQFADQSLAAVVTTAALAAGVDFPASHVIFDSLAMGIEWLTAQEFHQMLGRAGRPDYHDTGTVWILVEPNGTYHSSMEATEDEIAFALLNDNIEDVAVAHTGNAALEETLANITVAGTDAKRLNDRMIGTIDTTQAIGELLSHEYIRGTDPTRIGRVVAEHFLDPDTTDILQSAITNHAHPFDMVSTVETRDDD